MTDSSFDMLAEQLRGKDVQDEPTKKTKVNGSAFTSIAILLALLAVVAALVISVQSVLFSWAATMLITEFTTLSLGWLDLFWHAVAVSIALYAVSFFRKIGEFFALAVKVGR